ncbi:MAG: bifunctional phosphoribosylaminoimidazolecarboxamide formyltransferase/IMP cyclohydrolase, partial [Proteobacteria bacterium]|nr:bifunctional phosphoribosylaminoimidazolecarboxamide formyltransferase/IMP cyclohydrolase [Pseudomonadota bacterium]
MEKKAVESAGAVPVKRVLVSVSNKSGIVEFSKKLAAFGVEIISTGGTAKTLFDAGIEVRDLAGYTGFPEIMDGRVKTLHPKVHGGILARRNDSNHRKAMEKNDIEGIDMVVVSLYPFIDTVKSGADFDACIENIDIGGVALIRAAAKNHEFVTILTDPQDYDKILEDMKENEGAVSLSLRRALAANAFALTATYDSNIAGWFASQAGKNDFPRRISFSGNLKQPLRYGENP